MPDHVIVDGYNVLYAWKRDCPRQGTVPFSDLSVAREALLRALELAAATRGVHSTVVFDGRPIEDVAHASSKHLTVLFAGPHSSADAVIERLVCQGKRAALKGGPFPHLVVVTDDRVLGNLAVGWGAACWSSQRLVSWLAAST